MLLLKKLKLNIFLALIDMMKKEWASALKNIMLIGFGVGLSWGGCVVDLKEMKC